MVVPATDLETLKAALMQQREKIDERVRAITLVQEMIRQNGSAMAELLQETEWQKSAVASVSAPKLSFAEAVKAAATELKTRRFTGADVDKWMRDSKRVDLPKKYVRERIATILKQMVASMELELVQKGGGNLPNVYTEGVL